MSRSGAIDLALIAPGDIVLVNKRGQLFHARVLGTHAGSGYSIAPLDRDVRHRHAAADELTEHWRRATRDTPRSAQQLVLDLERSPSS
jgi:hypothetical protein